MSSRLRAHPQCFPHSFHTFLARRLLDPKICKIHVFNSILFMWFRSDHTVGPVFPRTSVFSPRCVFVRKSWSLSKMWPSPFCWLLRPQISLSLVQNTSFICVSNMCLIHTARDSETTRWTFLSSVETELIWRDLTVCEKLTNLLIQTQFLF